MNDTCMQIHVWTCFNKNDISKTEHEKKHNINNCIKKLCTKARIDVNQMNTCEYNPIIVANQTTYIYIYVCIYM